MSNPLQKLFENALLQGMPTIIAPTFDEALPEQMLAGDFVRFRQEISTVIDQMEIGAALELRGRFVRELAAPSGKVVQEEIERFKTFGYRCETGDLVIDIPASREGQVTVIAAARILPIADVPDEIMEKLRGIAPKLPDADAELDRIGEVIEDILR